MAGSNLKPLAFVVTGSLSTNSDLVNSSPYYETNIVPPVGKIWQLRCRWEFACKGDAASGRTVEAWLRVMRKSASLDTYELQDYGRSGVGSTMGRRGGDLENLLFTNTHYLYVFAQVAVDYAPGDSTLFGTVQWHLSFFGLEMDA
jgi:hypothetical protein